MPRPAADDPKCHTVSLRLTKSERDQLDRDRKGTPITDYLRAKLFGRGRS